VAALKAQVSFFSGSYADALREAELTVRQRPLRTRRRR
jgi:hypothetical protein